ALAAGLDGGLDSPMIVLLFFPLSIAAMGFAPRAVYLHTSTTIVCVLGLGLVTSTLTLGPALLMSSSLLTTGLVGSSIARRQRGLAAELFTANEELNRLARTDPLTACLNR